MKYPEVTTTRNLRLQSIVFAIAFGWLNTAALAYDLPNFRVPDGDAAAPKAGGPPVRLLADADFPPYSFESQGGGPAGLAVELALAACTRAKLRCDMRLVPFDSLMSSFEAGQGDAVISGVRLDEVALDKAVITRPWFRTMGRFAVLSGNPLAGSDAAAMAGKRIGVIGDTVHARWLARHYSASETVPFDDEAKAYEALRTGNVDAYFGDNLRIIYWVAGSVSERCCRLLGGAYSDFDTFSRNLSFVVRGDRDDLRAALDYGLDAAQTDGTTERIFNAYVPLSPW